MLSHWTFRILIVLLLLISLSYFIPFQKKDFFEIYKTDDDASKSLKLFLASPTKSITVDRIDWHYYTSESAKPCILFCHGMGGAYELWWQQINYFEKNYNVISYTLPEDISSLKEASNGILAILKKEKITDFTLVGTSMGGYIGQYLQQQIPNRINQIVLSNTFPPNQIISSKNSTKSRLIPLLPEILVHYIASKQLEKKLVPAGGNSKLLGDFLSTLPFSKKQLINRFSVVVDDFKLVYNSKNISQTPMLIIESTNDPLVEKELRELLRKSYPKARVFTFKDKGHFPYINAAEKYNKVLSDFLTNER